MKAIKIISIILAILIGALLVLAWNLNSIVQKFKPELQDKISSAINTPVEFDELSVSLFPPVSLELSNARIQGETESISINKVLLKTKLTDIFAGKISISEFIIDQAQIELARNQDGSLSIGGINLAQKIAEEQSPTKEEASTNDDAASSINFAVDSAQIKQAQVIFHDRSIEPAQKFTIKDINISVENFEIEGSGIIDASANILDSQAANLKIGGYIGNPLIGQPLKVALALNPLDLGKMQNILQAYELLPEGLTVSGPLRFELSTDMAPQGLVAKALIDLSPVAIKFADAVDKKADTALALHVETIINIAEQSVSSKDATLRLGISKINFPFNVSPLHAGEFKINLDTLNLSDLAALSPLASPFALKGSLTSALTAKVSLSPLEPDSTPELHGSLTFRQVGLQVPAGNPDKQASLEISPVDGVINFEGKKLTTKDFKVVAAGQPLSVNAQVQSFDKPVAAIVVKSDNLKLFPLAKPFAPDLAILESSELNKVVFSAGYSTATGAGDINLTTGSGTLANMPLEEISIKAKLEPNAFQLAPSTIRILGGLINAKAEVTLGEAPTLALNLTGAGLNAGSISKAFIPQSPIWLSGTIEKLNLPLNAKLNNMPASLTGNTEVKLVNGAIEGINIIGQVLSKVKGIPGIGGSLEKSVPDNHKGALQGDSTAFDSLQILTQLGDNRIGLRNVELIHPLYELSGNGTLNYAGAMNLRAQFRLTKVIAEGMLLKEPKLKLLMDERGSIVIPVLIRKEDGPMLVIPDVEDLIKRAASGALREGAARALDKALDKGIGRGIGSILGR